MWKQLFSTARQRPAQVPEGIRIYAIGDIHGRADLLDRVLSRIDVDLITRPIARAIHVFLGDYIDRGPCSKEVLDQLVQRARNFELVCLMGNHEAFLLNFLDNPSVLTEWRQYGGLETLMSYGLSPSMNPDALAQSQLAAELDRVLPPDHREFLGRLQLSFSCGDFFFAHAGIRPRVPLLRQQEKDLLWIREEFLLSEEDYGKIVVHGHTPVKQPEVRPNRINIDTGAYATGRLTCLQLERDKMRFV